MNVPHYTYRAILDNEKYSYIGFYKRGLFLQKTNSKTTRCGECGAPLLPSEGISHKAFHDNYFVCIPCAKKLIVRNGSKGYTINALSNLQSCSWQTGKYTAHQVIESIQKFTSRPDEVGLPILSPVETT